MAYLSHNEANREFRDRIIEGLASHFPIDGKKKTLAVERFEVPSVEDAGEDIRGQHVAKVNRANFSVPIFAHFALTDKETGTVTKKRMRVAELPIMTKRFGFIIGGEEKQIDSQWTLRPGVYTRRDERGLVETQFNVQGHHPFELELDPATGVFQMARKGSHIPLYPLLREAGVSDDTLQHAWGADILKANKMARGASNALMKFYRADKKTAAASEVAAKEYFQQTLQRSTLRPEVTQLTLGKPYAVLSGDVLRAATEKMLRVQRGEPEDDRDSLAFKDLRGFGDIAHAALTHYEAKNKIIGRALRKLHTANDPSELVKFDDLNRPIHGVFRTMLATSASQVNPLDMLAGAQRTTLMGPGGISSDQQITEAAQHVNPSHMSYLDPLHTPEGGRTGVSRRLGMMVKKQGTQVLAPMFNVRTGKLEYISPVKMLQHVVAMPDQVQWKGGKPVPVGSTVRVAGERNTIKDAKWSQVDYVMPTGSQLFSTTINTVPFLSANSGNRVTYGSHHIEQAVSLLNREQPLVQVATGGTNEKISTFEGMLGHRLSHVVPVTGKVVSVKPDAVVIEDAARKRHEVQLYNHFPLNDPSSMLHSTVREHVKPGAIVKAGDHLADTNFTRDGKLALGTNVRVAYLPYHGLNFEDGIVASESAAKRFSSVHMHKPSVQRHDQSLHQPRRFAINMPGTFGREQLEKLDDEGVVRVGQRVMPGDPLVLATRPYHAGDRVDMQVSKKLGRHIDQSEKWEEQHAGEVVAVHKKNNSVTVHVRSIEPLQVGDKLSSRAANKGIVSAVIPDHLMPHDRAGKPFEVLLNPMGVGNRMNLTQMYETAAGKIAKKTGQPYVVKNFAPETDYHKQITEDLAKHQLADTEEVFDPRTGRSLGKVFDGYQHMFKLKHMIDKKTAVRSGMSIPGEPSEKYDINLVPSRGRGEGGQSVGLLGTYALLSHGAVHNLREMQTFKSQGNDPRERIPSQHRDVWAAIQNGTPLPPPKPTFAFNKFLAMLTGAGINVEKLGHTFRVSPLTDQHVMQMAKHEIKDITRLAEAKLTAEGEPKPLTGGIFDKALTGGYGGSLWSYHRLAEPVPNPLFERPIKHLLGITGTTFSALLGGKQAVDEKGSIVRLGTKGSVTGGNAIKRLLGGINVDHMLAKDEAALEAMRPKSFIDETVHEKLDRTLKRVQYLRGLKQLKMNPVEAYMMHVLPILPPVMRPPSIMQDGSIKWEDINGLYQKFGQLNNTLRNPEQARVPDSDPSKQSVRERYYDLLKGIVGVGNPEVEDKMKSKGLLQQIHGPSPKEGFFQKTLLNRRQDLSIRSVIVPEPNMGIDEVMLPRDMALKLYQPFVVRKLVEMGAAPHALEAQRVMATKKPIVYQALERVTQERPVVLKRDPMLHRYGIMGFTPKLTTDKTIKIHPLVTGGFNADFDGNCCLGSTKIVLQLPCNWRDNALKPPIAWLEERYEMKFTSDTKIFAYMAGGYVVEMRMDQVPYRPETRVLDKNGASVYEVPAGLYVWSYRHESGAGSFEPFTHLTIEDNCEIARVETRSHEVVASVNESLCTYDHETGNIHKVCPKDAVGQLSPIVRGVAVQTIGTSDADIGWTVGAFASDGFITGQRTIGYSKISEAHRAAFRIGLTKMVGQVRCHTYSELHVDCDIEGESIKEHYLLPKEAFVYFKSFYGDGPAGRSCLRKRLPDLGAFTPSGLMGILSGLLDGDGSLSVQRGKKKAQFQASYSTSSQGLVTSIEELCFRLGLRVSYTESQPKEGRLQKSTAYTLSFSSVDLYRLLPHLTLHKESNQQARQFLLDNPPTKDDLDIVPVPHAIMDLLTATQGPLGQHQYLRSCQVVKSSRKPYWYVARATAVDWLDLLESQLVPKDQEACGLVRWAILVRSQQVGWERVMRATEIGRECVYDLCVPTTKVFAVDRGLIIWDTMAAYVPISHEAVQEARNMMPSNHLFNEARGTLLMAPTLEAQAGLYRLTMINKRPVTAFSNPAAALLAAHQGKLHVNDPIKLPNQQTTVGRLLLADTLPQSFHTQLHDPQFMLDSKRTSSVLQTIATKHAPEYGTIVNRLKDLANGAATGLISLPNPQAGQMGRLEAAEHPQQQLHISIPAHTLTLADIAPDHTARDPIFKRARAAEIAIHQSTGTQAKKDAAIISVWRKADDEVKARHQQTLDPHANNMVRSFKSGAKPGWVAYKQIRLAPTLIEGQHGIVPTGVHKSFAEGIDAAGYWASTYGAQKGLISKGIETQEPGYFNKRLIATTLDLLVSTPDCGTTRGVAMSASSNHLHDRELARDHTIGQLKLAKGTNLSPDVLNSIRAIDPHATLTVRSPLKCEHHDGLCQKCSGLTMRGTYHPIGTNLGIQSAQALGERSAQLVLKSFHSAGAAGGRSSVIQGFGRIRQLTELPNAIPGQAVLAMKSGTISKIQPEKLGTRLWIDDHEHFIPLDVTGQPLHQHGPERHATWQPPKVGMKIEAGYQLSDPNRTTVNPRTLYQATRNFEKVQNFMTDELHRLYDGEVRRMPVEVVVKGMTNLARVRDAGDAEVLKGEYHALSNLRAINAKLVKANKRPATFEPILKGIDTLPQAMREDWMAHMISNGMKESVMEAVARGRLSNIHSNHPIPALAYGAELGLTRAHAVKMRDVRLQTVEEHKY